MTDATTTQTGDRPSNQKTVVDTNNHGDGDPCPECGHALPDVNATPVVCSHCGAEVE